MNALLVRRLSLLGLAVILAASALGQRDGATARAVSTAQSPVTITWFWRIDPLENAWEKRQVAAFEARHPNIKVNLVLAPGSSLTTKFNTLLNSTPPDVTNMGFQLLYGRGLLTDLSHLVTTSGFDLSRTPATIVNQFRRGKGLYALPEITLGTYLFYNRDIFDAYNKAHPTAKIAYPPVDWNDRSWTWTKMADIATKLTDPTKQQYGIFPSLYPQSAYAWLAGTSFFSPSDYKSGTATHITLNTPALAKILQTTADWANKQHIAPSYSSQQAASNSGVDLFATGKVAMELVGGWGFRNYNGAKFRWSAAAVPSFVTNKVPLFTDPFEILKSSKHPAEAFTFIQFMLGPSSMQDYVRTVAFTPSNLDDQPLWYQQEADKTGLSIGQLRTLVSGASTHGQESDDHTITNFTEIYTLLTNGWGPIFSGHTTAAKQLPVVESEINNQLQAGQ